MSANNIKELALAIATMDLDELVEGHRRRLLILDSQIEALRQERAEFRAIVEVLNACTLELSQIAKRYDANRIHQRLNALIASGLKEDKTPGTAGENRWQKGNSPSNRYRTLDVLSKKTH